MTRKANKFSGRTIEDKREVLPSQVLRNISPPTKLPNIKGEVYCLNKEEYMFVNDAAKNCKIIYT